MKPIRPLYEPNYNTSFHSSVVAYQTAFNGYKKSVNDFFNHFFINSEGRLCVLAGYQKQVDKINEFTKNLEKASIDVEYYRNKCNKESEE